MNKKLICIFVLFGAFFLSCTAVKQPITFQKEIGFHYDCSGIAPDCIHVEIKRGFALGEEEINIETHQGYVKSGVVHWQGKTTDKNGDELPFVDFYEIDSTYYEDLQYTDKYHESYYGHFLGTSDEHGNFNIRSRTKSCQVFLLINQGILAQFTIFAANKHSIMKRLPLPTLLFLLLCLPSCKESQQSNDEITTNNQDVYDFHILYAYNGESMEEWFNTNYNRDNLHVVVEGWYNNDTISISADGKPIAQDSIVQTEPSTETSAGFIIPNVQTIKQLSLKVNSSPTISFEIARKDFIFIGIRKHEKNIEVVFYKRPPRYD